MHAHRPTLVPHPKLLLWLILAATLVISPCFFLGDSSGHDFLFHLQSWMEVNNQWRHGTIYPSWAQWSNFGFGEPRFIFYPPASWILGAALGFVLPWRMVPGAYIWIMLVLAGLTMHRLAREWLAPRDAIAAAVLFAVNPYHLVIVYYRSDFSELLASALFPLLVARILRLGREGWRALPGFAFVFALIWLSNAPLAVIATYFVAAIVIVYCFVERSLRAFLPAIVAGATGFLLAAFYILPAAYEQRWVNINDVLEFNLQPWHNFLFAHSGDPEFVLFNWKVSAVALLLIGVFAISAVFAARQRFRGRVMFWIIFTLGALPILLMFPLAIWVWEFLPEMKFVQFPWRTLSPLALAAAFFFAAALGPLRRKWILWLAAALCLAALSAWMTTNNWWDSAGAPVTADAMSSGDGYEGTDEYVPLGCDRFDLPEDQPEAAALDPATGKPLDAPDIHVNVERWLANRRDIAVDSPRPINLAVKLYRYPAWKATLNGQPVETPSSICVEPLQLTLPAGQTKVEFRFTRTEDRTAGDAASAITAAALILLLLIKRKKFPPRLERWRNKAKAASFRTK